MREPVFDYPGEQSIFDQRLATRPKRRKDAINTTLNGTISLLSNFQQRLDVCHLTETPFMVSCVSRPQNSHMPYQTQAVFVNAVVRPIPRHMAEDESGHDVILVIAVANLLACPLHRTSYKQL